MTSVRSLQKLIHAACRQLGLDADARRDLQLRVTGKASMREMAEADLRAVAKELKGQGFDPAARRRKAAPRSDLRFIHVIWRLLGEAGALNRPGRAGLNAFIRARFTDKWGSVPIDVDALRDAGQINDVIRALKDWCERAGVELDR